MEKSSELKMEEPDVKEYLEGKSVAETSKIASVEVKKASEIFGKKAIDPEKRIIKIETENDADLTISLPKGLDYVDGKWRVLNKLQFTRSFRNKASKFGAFARKYEKWPNVGAEVETDLDDEDFPRIVV